MKAYRVTHITANILAFGLLGAFLVFFLLSYGGLPERIGVHFSPMDGDFDVIADKLFGFYPFVAGFGLLALFSLLSLAAKKVKNPGLKVTEKGERVFRCAAVLLLDLMKLTWAVFFSYWTYCVVYQTPMGDGSFLDAFRVFFILILLSVPVLFSEIQERHRSEPRESAETGSAPLVKPKRFRVNHIAANVVSFGALGAFLVYFLLSYSALPEQIGVHFGGDGDFDVVLGKIFGFYPFVAGFGLLTVFSLLNLAVNRIKRIGMNVDGKGELLIRLTVIEALDTLKLIWSVFFSVWAWCVIHQTAMNTTFMGIITAVFLALFPITGIAVFMIARRYRPRNDSES
ncbi:MAG: hypothetical protein IK093_11550 [Ruminiclostridium sp.]|nr:hypothetical protein [Ruminiclostridium sp.]